MTTLVMVAILVFGIVAYKGLPVSDLPNVDFPTITVTATLPGTAPQTMASTVATPLEKSFSTIAGIDNMTSTSSLGQSQIVVQFGLDRDINAAAQDVQAAITQTLLLLPKGIIPPSWQKTNPADAPILTLALTSPQEKLSTLDEYGETTIAQRLSMVGGVAQVLVYGTQKYAVRLQMDPAQLATRSIALEDVFTAVTNQNVNIPTGVLWGPKTALTIQATGQLDNADQFKDMIITYRNGAPVYLHELGRIVDDVQNNKTASWYNGEPAIVLAIQRQPGTNTVDVSNRVKAELAKVKIRHSGVGQREHFVRPVRDDPGVRARRDVHARAHARARRADHLPVSAQRLRDGDPEPRAADVDHRHVLGDVRCCTTASTISRSWR